MLVKQLTTSLYHDKIDLIIENKVMIFNSLPHVLLENQMLVVIVNEKNIELFREEYNVKLPFKLDLTSVNIDGLYYLQLYHRSTSIPNYYISLNSSRGIQFMISGKSLDIRISNNFESNKLFFEKIKNDYFHKITYKSPTSIYHSDRPEIIQYAKRITQHAQSTYQKILAVHDWVSDNMYYDIDALNSGKYAYEKYDPLILLATRKCVCRGYSKLAVTLLRSINIPAIDVLCNADGEGICDDNEANHVITFALNGGRWIIMDPTWDSVNIFQNGKYSQKTQVNIMRQYFDTTIAFISYTHKFIK